MKSYSRDEINKTHLPYDGLRILVNALVTSRLDYCNSRYLASLSIKGINLNEFRMLRLVLGKDGKPFFMQTRNAFLVIGLTVLNQELQLGIPQIAQ